MRLLTFSNIAAIIAVTWFSYQVWNFYQLWHPATCSQLGREKYCLKSLLHEKKKMHWNVRNCKQFIIVLILSCWFISVFQKKTISFICEILRLFFIPNPNSRPSMEVCYIVVFTSIHVRTFLGFNHIIF